MSPKADLHGISALSCVGAQQGDPLATVAFCLAIHPDIMALQKKLHAIDKNNLVIACSDDVYVVADMDSLPLIEQFGKDINANTDLTMVPSKSNILGNPTTIQD